MAVFRENDEDLNCPHTQNKPLELESFVKSFAEQSVEMTTGYREAVADIVDQLNKVLYIPHGNGFVPNTASGVRTEIKKMFHSQKILLVDLTQLLSQSEKPLPDSNYNSTNIIS